MKVSEIMSSPVVVTNKKNKISSVRNLIERKNIHAIPVLEQDGGICGIISSIDLAKEHNESEIVQNVMSEKVHVIHPSSRVIDAANMLLKQNVHHLVVMKEGQVIGMVSSMDIVQLFSDAE